MAKNELVTQETAGVPAYLQDYAGPTGQDFSRDEILIPQLKLGQAMSPEVKEGALSEGDIFLNLTGDKLGGVGEPLEIVVIAHSTEAILWRDRNFQGGGVMARAPKTTRDGRTAHFWDKPNQTFENKIKGVQKVTWNTGVTADDDGLLEWGSEIPGDEDSKIAATMHHNFVVYIPSLEIVAALSLSKTQTKAAKALKGTLGLGRSPIFSRRIQAVSYIDSRDDDTFANWKFKQVGFVEQGVFEITRALFEQFSETGFTVDQSEGAGDKPNSAGEEEGSF